MTKKEQQELRKQVLNEVFYNLRGLFEAGIVVTLKPDIRRIMKYAQKNLRS